MTSIKYFRMGIEKNANIISGTVKHFIKHPWQAIIPTIAAGAGYSALKFGLKGAKEVHPAHQIYMETKKQKALENQSKALSEILSELKKTNIEKPKNIEQKLINPILG